MSKKHNQVEGESKQKKELFHRFKDGIISGSTSQSHSHFLIFRFKKFPKKFDSQISTNVKS